MSTLAYIFQMSLHAVVLQIVLIDYTLLNLQVQIVIKKLFSKSDKYVNKLHHFGKHTVYHQILILKDLQ